MLTDESYCKTLYTVMHFMYVILNKKSWIHVNESLEKTCFLIKHHQHYLVFGLSYIGFFDSKLITDSLKIPLNTLIVEKNKGNI